MHAGQFFGRKTYRIEAQAVFGQLRIPAIVRAACHYIGRHAAVRKLMTNAAFQIFVGSTVRRRHRRSFTAVENFKLKIILRTDLLQHIDRFLDILRKSRPQIGDHRRMRRNDVCRIRSLHHCKGTGRPKQRTCLIVHLRHQFDQERPEQPQIAHQKLHPKIKGRSHPFKHRLHMRRHHTLKRLFPVHIRHKFTQPRHRRLGLRRTGMSTFSARGHLQIDIALLRNADHRIRTVHACHRLINDRAAFIQSQRQTVDAMCLQPVDRFLCPVARRLFIDRIGQIHIARRHKALRKQSFNC